MFTGMEEVAKGWKSVSAYDVEDDEDDRDVESEESLLPSFNKGDKFKCESTVIKSRKTSSPVEVHRSVAAFGNGEPVEVHNRQKDEGIHRRRTRNACNKSGHYRKALFDVLH